MDGWLRIETAANPSLHDDVDYNFADRDDQRATAKPNRQHQ